MSRISVDARRPRPVLVTGPSEDVVSVDEVKNHLRVTHALEDAKILQLIKASTRRLDGPSGLLGRCLISQVWRVYPGGWHGGLFTLPVPDVDPSSVVIRYLDEENAEQTLSSDLYRVAEGQDSAFVEREQDAEWPGLSTRADAVSVTFTAGFGEDPDDVPSDLREALLEWIAQRYWAPDGLMPGSMATLPDSVRDILLPYKRIVF